MEEDISGTFSYANHFFGRLKSIFRQIQSNPHNPSRQIRVFSSKTTRHFQKKERKKIIIQISPAWCWFTALFTCIRWRKIPFSFKTLISLWQKKQCHIHLGWPMVSKSSGNFHFWVIHSFKPSLSSCTCKEREREKKGLLPRGNGVQLGISLFK